MKHSLIPLAIAVTVLSLETARPFTPPPPLPEWKADAATVGMYEFPRSAVKSQRVENLVSGKAPAGELTGKWEWIVAREVEPGFPGAARAVPEKTVRAQATFRETGLSGAFSIDLAMRLEAQTGYFLKVGKGEGKNAVVLLLGIRFRGPGEMSLVVPVKDAGGAVKKETLNSTKLFEAPGMEPLRYEDFYVVSLTYDGNRTFTVLVNGRKAYEGSTEGEPAVDASVVTAGNVADWSNVFQGDLAGVRLSSGVREYTAAGGGGTAFSAQAKRGWMFDAGKADSPVSAGAIGLTMGDVYGKARGYGWLGKPKKDFDSWYSPARYQSDPQAAYKAGTYKIHFADMRDGVTVPEGEIFRADVPDGRYWVTVGVGDSWAKAADVPELTANGTKLGEDLRTQGNVYGGMIPQRLARGLVEVKGGEGVVIAGKLKSGEGIAVESISILPYAPLPVVWKDGVLTWQGAGAAPKELAAVSAAAEKDDFPGAVEAAEKIDDPLVRANVLACVMGKPRYPKTEDLAVARMIRQALLAVLQKDPDNVQANWLYDSTERYRHVLRGYVDESGDEVMYGTKGLVRYHTANLGLAMRPEDPQYWQGLFLAGAGIWQNGVQSSAFGATSDEYLPLKKERLLGFDAPGKYFRQVTAGWPDFRIARIMLGEKLPIVSDWKAPENAPQWAVMQYQLQHRILDVLHYWVDERMDSKGLLGGGLGDDVEALRWWGSSVTLSDDAKAKAGWRKLSDAAWESTGGLGFAKTLQDVEHSAEDTSDSQPFLAYLAYGTPELPSIVNRLTKTKAVFRDVWSTEMPEGRRMMKGHFLSATQVDREGDVPYNIRAMRPLLWAAWINAGRDKELDGLLVAYAKNWRDAMMTEFDTKPKGIVPMMILGNLEGAKKASADGHLNQPTSWVFPGYWSFFYPAGYAEKAYDLLLAGYALSGGDRSFLDPITYGLEAIRKIPADDMDAGKYAEGSFDWAIRSGAGMIGLAGANYRALTGDHSYDDVLLRIAPAHCRFTILAEQAKSPAEMEAAMKPLVEKLTADLGEMNTSPELRTTIIDSTDRIYVCGSLVVDAMSTGIATSDKDLRGGEIIWPNYQITWQDTDGELAALVRNATPTGLSVLLYNFAEEPLKARPRVWRLEPGMYELTLVQTDRTGFTAEKTVESRTITVEKRGDDIALAIPARVPLRLELKKTAATAAAR